MLMSFYNIKFCMKQCLIQCRRHLADSSTHCLFYRIPGKRSCFFNPIVQKEYVEKNPLKVLESVYDVIADRKANPKEGSYTNHILDKGIDQILKKLGEEATEIVIAAKNPEAEAVKFEITDFIYHCMILMVEKGITWEDITTELAQR